MVTLDEIYKFTNDYFIDIYSEYPIYTSEKNIFVSYYISNAFLYLASSYSEEDETLKNELLEMAFNHLNKATLDCQKIILTALENKISNYYIDPSYNKFCTTKSTEEITQLHQEFKKNSLEIMDFEVTLNSKEEVDLADRIELVNKYDVILKKGYDLIEKIDPDAYHEHKDSFNKKWYEKWPVKILIGFTGGISAAYVFHTIIVFFI